MVLYRLLEVSESGVSRAMYFQVSLKVSDAFLLNVSEAIRTLFHSFPLLW